MSRPGEIGCVRRLRIPGSSPIERLLNRYAQVEDLLVAVGFLDGGEGSGEQRNEK